MQCGELHLDLVHRRATLGDAPMHLPPRIIDLLAFFLAAPDQLHSREAILADVWEGLVVEEGSLGQAVWLLRKAMGPERRESLQSVPKRGYVFHPWGPVSLVSRDLEGQCSAVGSEPLKQRPGDEVPGTPFEAVSAEPGKSRSRAAKDSIPTKASVRWGRRVAAALLLVGLLLASATLFNSFAPPKAGDPPRTIAVLIKPMPGAALRERQLALLLEDWLQYRLGTSVQTLVLTAADLDEEEAYQPTLTLLLSAVPIGSDTTRSKLRVELLGQLATPELDRMEGLIELASIDADLDRFAGRLLERLDGLSTDAAPARFAVGKALNTYAAALDAARSGAQQELLQRLEAALVDAPEFAPLRLRLARALAAQGEQLAANEHYRTAKALDSAWAPDSPYTLELERAQANTFADKRRVAEKYLELHRSHPQRQDLLLDAIEAESSPVERMRLLEQADWSSQPSVIQRRAKLLECWALLTLGRPPDAEACADSVVAELAVAVNVSALRHLGDAKAVIAIARYNQALESADFAEFKDAAQIYRQAGLEFQALRIEAQSELLRGHPGRDPMPQLERLMSIAQKNQMRSIELNLHRSLAVRLGLLEDPEGRLAHLESAARLAALFGSRREIVWVSLALAAEHWDRNELSEVERVLDDLSAMELDLDTRAIIAARRALVVSARGMEADADRILRETLKEIRASAAEPISAESHALVLLGLIEQSAKAADVKGLKDLLPDFRRVAPEHLVFSADIYEILLLKLEGNQEGAISALQRLLADEPLRSDRWESVVWLALQLGQLEIASELLGDACGISTSVPSAKQRLKCTLARANIAVESGDVATASSLLAEIEGGMLESTPGVYREVEQLRMRLAPR